MFHTVTSKIGLQLEKLLAERHIITKTSFERKLVCVMWRDTWALLCWSYFVCRPNVSVRWWIMCGYS